MLGLAPHCDQEQKNECINREANGSSTFCGTVVPQSVVAVQITLISSLFPCIVIIMKLFPSGNVPRTFSVYEIEGIIVDKKNNYMHREEAALQLIVLISGGQKLRNKAEKNQLNSQ